MIRTNRALIQVVSILLFCFAQIALADSAGTLKPGDRVHVFPIGAGTYQGQTSHGGPDIEFDNQGIAVGPVPLQSVGRKVSCKNGVRSRSRAFHRELGYGTVDEIFSDGGISARFPHLRNVGIGQLNVNQFKGASSCCDATECALMGIQINSPVESKSRTISDNKAKSVLSKAKPKPTVKLPKEAPLPIR